MRKKGEPTKREPNHKGIGIHFERLEPRILLSGSWGAGMESPAPDIRADARSDFAQDTIAIYERTGRSIAAGEHQNQGRPGSGSTVDLLARTPVLETIPADHAGCSAVPGRIENDEAPSSYPRQDREVQYELVVVDAGIRNYGPLVDDILATAGDNRAFEVLVLDSGRDGVEQVSDALAGMQEIEALHILSHGSAGEIRLGATALSAGSLDDHADALAGWAGALDGSADILIYGCDVAATPDGRAFINTLAAMTGADVAASDDLTGSKTNDGDWQLEYRAGAIETATFHSGTLATWQGTLATIAHEGFDYAAAAGGLNNQSGGTGWSGSWNSAGTETETVAAGLNDPSGRLPTSGGAVQISTSPMGNVTQTRDMSVSLGANGTTAWFSFLVTPEVSDPLDYAGIQFGATAVMVGYKGGNFFIENAGGGGTVTSGVPTVDGETALVVVKAEFAPGNDTLSLYVNPTPGETDPDTTAVVKTDLDLGTFNTISITGGEATGTNSAIIDEVRVGDTFADVAPGSCYLDRFNAIAFTGNDGTLSWANDWQEIGEVNGAAMGAVSVWDELGEQGLYLWAADNVGVWRQADLSGATSATLSFDWAMTKTETGDQASLQISTDGMAWTTLDTFDGPLDHATIQSVSYDISAYIDNDTRIKFETNSGFFNNDVFFVDNVRIDLSTTSTATPTVNDDGYVTNQDTPLVVDSGSGLLANDTDPQGDTLTAEVTDGPDNGVLTFDPLALGTVTNLTNDAGVADSQAVWSPDGTKIAFSREVTGVKQVFVMNADGSGITQLTFGGAVRNHQAAWSPDGTRLAITSMRYGSDDIVIIDAADGSELLRLTTDGGTDHTAAWSPDGSQIAFGSDRVDGNHDIWVTNADGSGVPTQLTTAAGVDRSPEWSPDGSRILFRSSRDGDTNIYVMDADGGNQIQLTSDPGADTRPTWSPDGSRIAFISDRDGANNDVFVMDADGGNLRSLGTTIAEEQQVDWSPDGSRLVVNADNDIHVLGLRFDGSFTYTPDNGFAGGDTFTYIANDGSNDSVAATATVTVNDEQTLAVNTGITVDEGSADNTVTAAMLETTDADNTAAELVYTLTAVPSHGTLYRSGVALADSDTFTQDDIGNDLITYDHDDSENLSDGFAFSVDDGAGAATTGTFSITVTAVNDEPTLTATASDPTFTQGGAAEGLFSGTSASTVEVGQTLGTLVLTVTNAADGGNESLNIDGNQIALADGTTGTTSLNGLLFNVSVIGVTATVTLSGGTLSAAELETLVDGISYQHNSGSPTIGDRTVTLTSLVDSGGTANGGDDTATLAIVSTVTVEAAGGNAPVLGNNAISINQGGGIILDSTVLSASDVDNADAGLTFNVSNVSNGWFALLSDTATPITSFDQSEVTAGNVVFIHDGGELAPAYQVSVTDGSSSTAASAAAVTFSQTDSGVLWLSTVGDVGASNGVPGLDGTGWRNGDILQQAGPDLGLGEAATDGTFSIAFDPLNFGNNGNVNGIHVVTGSITIGSSNAVSLQAGDLLLTSANSDTFVSNGAAPQSDLSVDEEDIFYFRPDTPGDYSVGNFYLLLSDPFQDGAEIHGLALVEKNVWVGDVQLHAGDLLLSRSGGAEQNDIWLLETGTLDPTVGGSYPAAQRLIEGDDAGVDIEDKIYGLDIVETDISFGGRNYNAGTILVALDGDDGDGIGTTAQAADQQDIVALQVNKTSLGSGVGNAQVVATLMFDGDDASGNDVNFDSGSEALDAITLTVAPGTGNTAPTLDSSTLVVNEDQTVTLTDAMLSASDLNDVDSGLVFTVSSVSGGRFEIAGAPGVAVSSFTKGQVDAGDVLFVDDGDELAPAFDVAVSDGSLSDGPIAATVNFTPVNDEQTLAVNAGATVAEGSSGNTVTAAMLATTDADHTAGQLVYTLSGLPANGTLFRSGVALGLGGTFTQDDIDNGRLTYDHDGSEATADSFSFSVDDGAGAASSGTFSITVTPQNDSPTASGTCTIAGTNEDTISAAVQVSTIISDDSITVNDMDGDTIGIAVFDTAGPGNWQYSTNGVSGWTDFGTVNPNAALLLSETTWVRYVPDGTNGEIVGFDFRAWDQTTDSSSINGAPVVADTVPGGGTTAYSPGAASVALTITAANDEQVVATNTGTTVSEGGTGNTITAAMLQATDVDNSADQLVFNITTVPINGILYLNGMALSASDTFTQDDIDHDRLTYDHDGSETMIDSFAFSVDDGAGTASSGTFSITVTPQNDAPSATADSFTVAEGSTTRLDLAANDSDADDGLDPASITIVSGPGNGTIDSINADGTVDYTHDGGETLSDSFTYTIDDLATATSNTVTVSLTVTPVNDLPVGTPVIIGTVQEDGTLTADTSAIGDPDGLGAFSYQWQRSSDDGSTWRNVGTDTGTYVLGDDDVSTRIRLQVSYTDAHGAAEGPLTSAVTATVTNVNDAGVVTIDNTTPVQGTTLTAAVTDPDGATGPIAYQWQRDGVDIDGATGATYTTAIADVGAVITVTVDYTDDQTAVERLTSAGTTPVAGIAPVQVPTAAPPADNGDPPAAVPIPEPEEPEAGTETEAPATEPAAEAVAPPAAVPPAAATSGRQPTAARPPFLVKAAHQVSRMLGAESYVKAMARRQTGTPPDHQAEAPTDREQHPAEHQASRHNRMAARAYLNMVNALDEIKKEMAGDDDVNQTILGSAIAVSTGLSVGYVVWMIRGGMLLSSLLSSLPAWQILDPLPVLAVRKSDADPDDDESLASMLARQPRRADGKTPPAGNPTRTTEET